MEILGFNLKTELPYDPAIPLLGMHLQKTIIWKGTSTPVLIAAVFTIAKTWKQPKCPWTDEWIKKTWSIYTMESYSAIKEGNHAFAATWMDLEMITLSKVRQRKTNTMWHHSYVESLKKKMIQRNLLAKQEQAHRLQKQTYGYQRGKVGGEE